MWQRFTERSRRAVFFAQEEATRLGVSEVGPEHVLLGLVRENDCLATRILDHMGVSLSRIRSEIERQVTRGQGKPGQDMQLTPAAKRVIDLAYEEARQHDNNYIGTEHLLLGLLGEGANLAAGTLVHLGVDLERARRVVNAMQEGELQSSQSRGQTSGEETIVQPPATAAAHTFNDLPWHRLSERARRTMEFGQEEARRLGESYVGTEHLLLGLTRANDSMAARVLDRLGVPLGRIRSDIERQVTHGPGNVTPDTQLTSRAHRAIKLAFEEALQLTQDHIGTEHLLLGLIREGDGLAARILVKLGADLERTRREIHAMHEHESRSSVASPPSPERKEISKVKQDSLERLEQLARGAAEAAMGPGGRRQGASQAVAAARTVVARDGRLSDFVSAADLTSAQARALIALAEVLKATGDEDRLAHREILAGKSLAMVFEKPSLRTRVTFEVGMFQLGGHAISLQPAEIQLGKRETVADAARNLERWVDGIMARTFSHQHVVELAQNAGVPVINGLTDREHPCQALTDFLTIHEKKGRTEGLKLAYIGDGNNVAHSLLLLGAKLGTHITVAGPEGYEPDAEILRQAREAGDATGARIEVTHDPLEAVRDADIVYTDVWASMGQEAEAEERARLFASYRVNAELVRHARWDAIVMHDLPAHRGEEITDEVMDGPQAVIFDQAENRLHAQKALLAVLLG